MKTFVTGAAGQVGREVVDVFTRGAGVGAGASVVAAGRDVLDVSDRHAVMAAICAEHPDVVVHCAAWTAVDACESDPDRAWKVNALATRHVMEAARRVGAYVIYLSTDYVFDGTKPDPYVEWDATNPVSMYGRSKLGGELEIDPGCAVVRTAWVCGRHGGNMVKTVLRLAGEHPTLSFVSDQRGCPTFADDLATMLRVLAVSRLPGVYHVTNQGPVSWYEFAREVLVAAGSDPERVSPITTAELQPARPAPRPANSVLDNAALRLQGIELLPDFREPLGRLVRELIA
jgi:dTDP-4-dehydrorhamnose reductase